MKILLIGKIKIKNDNLEQRIINSYENVLTEVDKKMDWTKNKVRKNEKEIQNCQIFINDKKIKFTYFYKFPKEGDYIIKYKFKNLIESTNFMFYNCSSLISLDLSKFNTEKVTNMRYIKIE